MRSQKIPAQNLFLSQAIKMDSISLYIALSVETPFQKKSAQKLAYYDVNVN